MNKKFFTLMAAALLGGAAMPSEVTAQVHEPGKADSTLVESKLANGLKFMLRSHSNTATENGINFISVKDSTKTSFKVYQDSVATVTGKPAVFEVKNWNKSTSTFELYVDGKQFVKGIGGKAYGTFVAYQYGAATDKAGSWDSLRVVTTGLALDTVFATVTNADCASNIIHTYTTKTTQTAGNLNAYLNGSFKLGFPDAKTAPAVNPFGDELVAIPASKLTSILGNGIGASDAAGDSVFMAKKTDDAVKLAKPDGTLDAAKLAALELLVIDPTKNFGLTGFDGTKGQGYQFTTVKAGKLSSEANKLNEDETLDEVFYMNGLYKVNEQDGLNAAGKLTLIAGKFQYMNAAGASATSDADSVIIAAYTPTLAGSAYYVTTISDQLKEGFALAQMGGNSYVDTKTLLKTDGKAIYNIQFLGNKPEKDENSYGKYLVCVPENSDERSNWAAKAPAYVDLKNADAQWIVTGAATAGKLTLVSARDFKTQIDLSLYQADGGLYILDGGANKFGEGAEKVALTPATESATYYTLTDTELKQNLQIYFKGSDAITTSKVYVKYGGKDNQRFVATQKDYENTVFKAEKADTTIVKKYAYAYLKNGEVAAAEDKIEIPAYHLTWGGEKLFFKAEAKLDTSYTAEGHPASDYATKFVFKKNYDGSTNAIVFQSTGATSTSDFFADSLMNGQKGQLLYVNSSSAVLDSTILATKQSYKNIVLSFYSLGETLAHEPAYVTLNSSSEAGSISVRENAKGIVEGIISDEAITLHVDTADSKADFPTFYIRMTSADEELRAAEEVTKHYTLFNPANLAYYWNADKAKYEYNWDYYLNDYSSKKAVFVPAAVVDVDKVEAELGGETVTLDKDSKDLANFKFHITEYEDGYVITNAEGQRLFNLNGLLGFSNNYAPLVVTVGEGDGTANEAIEAEAGVQVIGGQGAVTVQGAAGKVITVANILGQTIANQVAASDNVTIAAPAGIVVVAVDGDATKVVVK